MQRMDLQNTDFKFVRSKFQVTSVSTITVLDSNTCSKVVDDLLYYKGFVSVSPGEYSIDCTATPIDKSKEVEVTYLPGDYAIDCNVIAFDKSKEVEVAYLCRCLHSVSSPFIMMPLAFGRGAAKFQQYCFLALPKFNCTFTQYIKETKIVDKNRFTEAFIKVISGIVHGMLLLEDKGFNCHHLKANDVLISISGNVVSSKIWKFQKRTAGEKSEGWIRLGKLIQSAAAAEQLVTAEVKDLCDKLINKGLEGLKVLKQSALLTPREKFENILALDLYIKVNSQDSFKSLLANYPEKQIAISDLLSLMQRTDIDWCIHIPRWILMVKEHISRSNCSGAEFVSWLRYIVEHEHLYIPANHQKNQTKADIRKLGGDPDLEAYVRNSLQMEVLFLEAQNVAADLDLVY